SDPQCHVEGDGPGRDHLDRGTGLVAEAHDRTLAEVAVDLGEGGLEGLLAICWCGHVRHLRGRGALCACVDGSVRPYSRYVRDRPYAEPLTRTPSPAAACGRRSEIRACGGSLAERVFEARRDTRVGTRGSGPSAARRRGLPVLVGPPALGVGDVERVAQRVPHVPRLVAVLEGGDRGAPVQRGQHLLPGQHAPVRTAEHLVDQLPEVALTHPSTLQIGRAHV